jgi:hypothetical protein
MADRSRTTITLEVGKVSRTTPLTLTARRSSGQTQTRFQCCNQCVGRRGWMYEGYSCPPLGKTAPMEHGSLCTSHLLVGWHGRHREISDRSLLLSLSPPKSAPWRQFFLPTRTRVPSECEANIAYPCMVPCSSPFAVSNGPLASPA